MNDNCLIIFVKNPELGKVKTRLAATVGDEKALSTYRDLLLHTCNISSKVNAKKIVFYSEFIDDNDLWTGNTFDKRLQSGKNLGEKMMNAFNLAFSLGFKNVSIIGSDCFEISDEIIENSLKHLTKNDAVVGPANDGGYYLLGLKKMAIELFYEIAWSTNEVFEVTCKRINQLNWKYEKLPILNDIDTIEDLNHHFKKQNYENN